MTTPFVPKLMQSKCYRPKNAWAGMILAHGAGAGMNHSGMEAIAEVLGSKGIATLRFQFPYMEKGSRRPDPPAVAVSAIAEAVALAEKKFPKLPLFAGGKSFGGRMTTTAASQGKLESILGIVCFGFPLHPPKKPSIDRAEHLKTLSTPTLWIQGTRDDLADLKLVRKVVKRHPNWLQVHVVDKADHSFHVLKSSGRTSEDVMDEIGKAAEDFCRSLL